MSKNIIELLKELDDVNNSNNGDNKSKTKKQKDVGDEISYDEFKGEYMAFKNGDNPKYMVLYVFMPSCPYCQEYMDSWKSQVRSLGDNLLDNFWAGKTDINNIIEADNIVPSRNSVPQVVLYYKDKNGEKNIDLSDPELRNNLVESVLKEISTKDSSISPENMEESVKTQKSKNKTQKGKGRSKNQRKTRKNQSGRGIVEGAVVASVLGATAISASQPSLTKKYIKKGVNNIQTLTNMTKTTIKNMTGAKTIKGDIKTSIKNLSNKIQAQKYIDSITDTIKSVSSGTAAIVEGKLKQLSPKELLKIYNKLKKSRKNK
jgi:hypothetical protein